MESPHTTLTDRSALFNEERLRGDLFSPQRIVMGPCACGQSSLNVLRSPAVLSPARDRGLDRFVGWFAGVGQAVFRRSRAGIAVPPYAGSMPPTLPSDAARATRSYLRAADQLLPGGVIACAVGGSLALRCYRPSRSDIDLVAVIADEWATQPDLIRRLHLLHLSQIPRLALRALRGKGVSACCNTVFIRESEVSRPVSTISPIASHVGEVFESGTGFDVNPVVWKELEDGGITIRGRPLGRWGLDPEPVSLRRWVRSNLRTYWATLADQLHARSRSSTSVLPVRRGLSNGQVEWCVLGPARMHHTLMTGDIISKERAGLHMLESFPQHAPITEVALAKVRGERIPSSPSRHERRALTASAMDDVLAAALEYRGSHFDDPED